MSPLRCFVGLGIAFGVLFALLSDARGFQDSRVEADQHYKDQLKRAKSAANAFKATVKNLSDFASQVNEASGMNEIAASIEPGRQLEVYVLHRVVSHFDGQAIDATLEVSPHPYPSFLTEPGTSYRVERKLVTGTGAYLLQGLPPYRGGKDLGGAHLPIEPANGPAELRYLESSRTRAQWSVYQITVELWKRQRQEPLPAMQTQVSDGAGNVTTVRAPPADVVPRLRQQLIELEKQVLDFEDIAQGQIDTFANIRSIDPGTVSLKRDQEAFKASLPELRLALERVGAIGGTQALTRDEMGFQSVLHALSKQISLRSAAYQQQLDLAREAERNRRQEEERRMRAIRRRGWDYLASVVGVACDDPEGASQLDADGRIIGIELSHTDFTTFFIDDVVTRNDLIGIVRGESVPKLNPCQEAVLRSMLDNPYPISLPELISLAEDWRADNPTLLERLGRAVEAMDQALKDLVNELAHSLRDTGHTWNSDSRSNRGPGESSGIDGGVGTIDLSPPDFGPGSTLGR